MEVVPLKNKTNQDAETLLLEMLEQVKSGEIAAISVAYTKKDGRIGGATSANCNNFDMLASLTHSLRSFEQLIFGDP